MPRNSGSVAVGGGHSPSTSSSRSAFTNVSTGTSSASSVLIQRLQEQKETWLKYAKGPMSSVAQGWEVCNNARGVAKFGNVGDMGMRASGERITELEKQNFGFKLDITKLRDLSAKKGAQLNKTRILLKAANARTEELARANKQLQSELDDSKSSLVNAAGLISFYHDQLVELAEGHGDVCVAVSPIDFGSSKSDEEALAVEETASKLTSKTLEALKEGFGVAITGRAPVKPPESAAAAPLKTGLRQRAPPPTPPPTPQFRRPLLPRPASNRSAVAAVASTARSNEAVRNLGRQKTNTSTVKVVAAGLAGVGARRADAKINEALERGGRGGRLPKSGPA